MFECSSVSQLKQLRGNISSKYNSETFHLDPNRVLMDSLLIKQSGICCVAEQYMCC